MKRRKIPELVQKLITVYGPTKRSVEEWKSDFEKTKKVRKTATTEMAKQAANVAEPVLNDDDAEQQADSFDQIELDVFMMEDEADSDFVLMPGDSVSAGVAATAVAVCATCRMLLEQCECKPRQRKATRAASPGRCLPCTQGPPRRPPLPASSVPVDKSSFTKEVYDAKGDHIGWAVYCGDKITFVQIPKDHHAYVDEDDGV